MGGSPAEDRFTAEQRRCLVALLDEIVPARSEARLPAAGELGVDAYIETALRQMAMFAPLIEQGLVALEDLSRRCKSACFADLTPSDKSDVLKELEGKDSGFLSTLTLLTFVGYYHHPRVVEALGVEPRPPHPGGYELPPNDLTLLEPVRRREKLYRD